MQTPGGNVNIGIDGMTHFLVVNIPGFRSVWDKFIMEPTPRVHKVLERADIAGDTTTMELLLSDLMDLKWPSASPTAGRRRVH